MNGKKLFGVGQVWDLRWIGVRKRFSGGSQTRPTARITGNRLVVNIDTDAAGSAPFGFVDEKGAAIRGFALEDCVYVNGAALDYEVAWLGAGKATKDLSALAGRNVRLAARLRDEPVGAAIRDAMTTAA